MNVSRPATALPTSRPSDLLRILQAAAVAANPAPSIEEALHAALRSYCVSCGWAGARLTYGARAPLSVRHAEDRARISGHRGVWSSAFPPAPEALWHEALSMGAPRVSGNVLVIPILEGEEAVGVIEATALLRPTPSPELDEALTHLGTQMGLIAERKRIEEELRRKRAHSEALLDNANAVVVGLDLDGNITVFNQAAESFTGWRREEVLGRSWFDVLAPRDRYPELFESFHKLASATLVQRIDAPLLTRGGVERHVHWRCSRVEGPGGVTTGTLWLGAQGEPRRIDDRTPIPLLHNPPARA